MVEQQLNVLYHCVYSTNYHLVFVTKYRRRCITQEILERLKEIAQRILALWEGELMEFNGEADHIHLLVSIPPKVAPSKLVNNLKTVTCRLIRKEFAEHLARFFRKPVFWSRSYCIISCGGAPLSVIKQYIEQQGEDYTAALHHPPSFQLWKEHRAA
jgi:putative transposase